MVVAYATLRGGAIAATTTIGVAVAAILVLLLVLSGKSTGFVALLIPFFWIPSAIGAETLRRTSNLPASIGVIALLGLAMAAVLALTQPLLQDFWSVSVDWFRAIIEAGPEGNEALVAAPLSDERIQSFLVGGPAVAMVTIGLAGLFLARSGQAKLLNPGGFQREFHALYFGRQVAMVCVVALIVGIVIDGAFGVALASIAIFPVLLQGLAVIHALVKSRSLSIGWLVGVYIVLFFVQPVTILISSIGFIDNLRRLPRQ